MLIDTAKMEVSLAKACIISSYHVEKVQTVISNSHWPVPEAKPSVLHLARSKKSD